MPDGIVRFARQLMHRVSAYSSEYQVAGKNHASLVCGGEEELVDIEFPTLVADRDVVLIFHA